LRNGWAISRSYLVTLTAADLGHAPAQSAHAARYYNGRGVTQNYALAAEWWREPADEGLAGAQYFLEGDVKKDLPMGKIYLELSAASGVPPAVEHLKELRKCVSCGELDVHHLICSQCRKVRYCDKECQLLHWRDPTDSHKLRCCRRRESAGAGGSSSERADSSANS
jgi:TPR repeat protein